MKPYEGLLLAHFPGAVFGQLGKLSVLQDFYVVDIWLNFSEEAYALLSKSTFFGAWDQDVLRSYVDYALTEDSSGQVRLKCTNIQVPAHATDRGGGLLTMRYRKRRYLQTGPAVSKRGRLSRRSTAGFQSNGFCLGSRKASLRATSWRKKRCGVDQKTRPIRSYQERRIS